MGKAIWVISLLALVLVAGFAYAGILYKSVNADVTVSEALSTATTTFSVPLQPGETFTQTITVHNSADVALNTEFTWVEGTNTDGVLYTTNAPFTINIPANSDVDVGVMFTANNVTPIGSFDGTVMLQRVA